jgi:hypothetical protein
VNASLQDKSCYFTRDVTRLQRSPSYAVCATTLLIYCSSPTLLLPRDPNLLHPYICSRIRRLSLGCPSQLRLSVTIVAVFENHWKLHPKCSYEDYSLLRYAAEYSSTPPTLPLLQSPSFPSSLLFQCILSPQCLLMFLPLLLFQLAPIIILSSFPFILRSKTALYRATVSLGCSGTGSTDCMRFAILFVRNCLITFYATSPADAIETLVSATFTTAVARDRTSRYFTVLSCIVVYQYWSAYTVKCFLLRVCCSGIIPCIVQYETCAGNREMFVQLQYSYKLSEDTSWS